MFRRLCRREQHNLRICFLRRERCDERVGRLPRNAWQRRACGIGSKGFRVYDWALIDSADPDHQYLIRRSIDDGELAFYTATTRTTRAWESSSTWPGRAGPSKNVSDPPRMRSDSTTTRYAPGTLGTDISPSPCSPTPSSPSSHTQPKRGASAKRTTEPAGQTNRPASRTGDRRPSPPSTSRRAHPRRNPSTPQPHSPRRTRHHAGPALVNMAPLAPSPDPPSPRPTPPAPTSTPDLAL